MRTYQNIHRHEWKASVLADLGEMGVTAVSRHVLDGLFERGLTVEDAVRELSARTDSAVLRTAPNPAECL
jgi:hypothetical protein